MRNGSEIQFSYTSFKLNKEGKRYKAGEMIRKLFRNQCSDFLTEVRNMSLQVTILMWQSLFGKCLFETWEI